MKSSLALCVFMSSVLLFLYLSTYLSSSGSRYFPKLSPSDQMAVLGNCDSIDFQEIFLLLGAPQQDLSYRTSKHID